MSQNRCQAKDPSSCRYHNAPVNEKFIFPVINKDTTVLGLVEKSQAKTYAIKYPIRREYSFQRRTDAENIINQLKKAKIRYSAMPNMRNSSLTFRIEANDEEDLKTLARVELQSSLLSSYSSYAEMKQKNEAIEAKNKWRKVFKKDLVPVQNLPAVEDWIGMIEHEYSKSGIETNPFK